MNQDTELKVQSSVRCVQRLTVWCSAQGTQRKKDYIIKHYQKLISNILMCAYFGFYVNCVVNINSGHRGRAGVGKRWFSWSGKQRRVKSLKKGAGTQTKKQTGLISMQADKLRAGDDVCRQSGECELLVDR